MQNVKVGYCNWNVMCSCRKSILARLLNCFIIVVNSFTRYKQHLAKLVKQHLNLETTPSTEMGETPQEVAEIQEEVAPESETRLVEPAPMVIGSAKQEPKVQPKGNLVIDVASNVYVNIDSSFIESSRYICQAKSLFKWRRSSEESLSD